ncbi:MAG: response regulator [Ignavibacterium sp.]|jgi:two-component system nitrogen regulation response regulator GlnG|nr:response regulator [Ignavibacterium sp.]
MIYIVDNDQNIRERYRMLLKSAGFDCKSFETAEEFLNNFHAEETELLLFDTHLPGMTGFDLLEKLKKEGYHLPVIIVTSYDEKESRVQARNYGVRAYLRKPIDSEALIDLIKYHLDFQKSNKRSIYS